MTRQLSSAWTFFNKFIFPALWIGMFALGTAGLFFDSNSPDSRGLRWGPLVGLIAGSAFLYWAVMRLKRVILEGDTLVISNYVREVRVPLADVGRVSGSILMNPELIWLHLRRDTEFGARVVFMPPTRLWRGFSYHPMVQELRDLVARASSGAVEQHDAADETR